MTLAKRLAKKLRSERGDLTQEVFARKIGVSRPTLNRLESATQNTTLKTLEQLAKGLRCDVGDLFEKL